MKIGDRIYVRGYIDEIRKDTVIIRNAGGYFGTIPSEVITGALPPAQPDPNCSEIPNNSDTISRQAAIEAIKKNTFRLTVAEEQNAEGHVAWSADAVYSDVIEGELLELPSAQQEIKPIEYRDCANAMLKMWMDNVVTDGEYNRIMDKLNAHWGTKNE